MVPETVEPKGIFKPVTAPEADIAPVVETVVAVIAPVEIEVGEMAPNEIAIAGVVPGFVTTPVTPAVGVTETVVTVPPVVKACQLGTPPATVNTCQFIKAEEAGTLAST